jgi:hypothetical protein
MIYEAIRPITVTIRLRAKDDAMSDDESHLLSTTRRWINEVGVPPSVPAQAGV